MWWGVADPVAGTGSPDERGGGGSAPIPGKRWHWDPQVAYQKELIGRRVAWRRREGAVWSWRTFWSRVSFNIKAETVSGR